MVDNVTITPGSGATIGTDDDGTGVQQQRVKVTWGPDGGYTRADIAAGKALPTQGVPQILTPIDHSGTITTGGTAQTAIAANVNRKGYIIHNPASASEILSVAFGGGYIDLNPGGTIDSSGLMFSGNITVKAATTSHAYTAYEGT